MDGPWEGAQWAVEFTGQQLKKDWREYWFECHQRIKKLELWQLISSLSTNKEKQRWEDQTLGSSNIKHFWKIWEPAMTNKQIEGITKWKNSKHLLGLMSLLYIWVWALWQWWVGYILFPLRSKSNGSFTFTLIISVDMSLGKLRELVMDREVWHAVVHGVAKGQTQLSDWTALNWMLPYFPGGFSGKESACQSRRLGFNPWVGKIPWRRKLQPTPVF